MSFPASYAVGLPDDADMALLVGRAWLPAADGPAVVAVHGDRLVDLSATAPTLSILLDRFSASQVREAARQAPVAADLAGVLANSLAASRDVAAPWLLAPCDLQPIKACGVTFVDSLLERLIEERIDGDPAKASLMRDRIREILGGELASIVPGSAQAARVREELVAQGNGRVTSRWASVPIRRCSPRPRRCPASGLAPTSACIRPRSGTTPSRKSCWR